MLQNRLFEISLFTSRDPAPLMVPCFSLLRKRTMTILWSKEFWAPKRREYFSRLNVAEFVKAVFTLHNVLTARKRSCRNPPY